MWRTRKTSWCLSGLRLPASCLSCRPPVGCVSRRHPHAPPEQRSSPELNLQYLWEEVSVKKRSLATTVKKPQQPRVWQRPPTARGEHLNVGRKTHCVARADSQRHIVGIRTQLHTRLPENKDRITQTHTSQTHQNPLILQVFALLFNILGQVLLTLWHRVSFPLSFPNFY